MNEKDYEDEMHRYVDGIIDSHTIIGETDPVAFIEKLMPSMDRAGVLGWQNLVDKVRRMQELSVERFSLQHRFDCLLAERNGLWGELGDIRAQYRRLLAAARAVTTPDAVYRGSFFNSTEGVNAWTELENAIEDAEKGQDA